MRPDRHAHTDGLTKCAVVTPRARKRFSSVRLKSGLSIPKKISGDSCNCWSKTARRMRSNSGSRLSGSTSPMTDSRSMGYSDCSPCACSSGPPIPESVSVSARARMARATAAPRISPDASPASKPRCMVDPVSEQYRAQRHAVIPRVPRSVASLPPWSQDAE